MEELLDLLPLAMRTLQQLLVAAEARGDAATARQVMALQAEGHRIIAALVGRGPA